MFFADFILKIHYSFLTVLKPLSSLAFVSKVLSSSVSLVCVARFEVIEFLMREFADRLLFLLFLF